MLIFSCCRAFHLYTIQLCTSCYTMLRGNVKCARCSLPHTHTHWQTHVRTHKQAQARIHLCAALLLLLSVAVVFCWTFFVFYFSFHYLVVSCGPVSDSTTDSSSRRCRCREPVCVCIPVHPFGRLCECGCFVWSVCLLRRRIPSSWECITRLVRFERQRSVYRMRANQSKFLVIACVHRGQLKKKVFFRQIVLAIVVAIFVINIFCCVQQEHLTAKNKAVKILCCLYGVVYAHLIEIVQILKCKIFGKLLLLRRKLVAHYCTSSIVPSHTHHLSPLDIFCWKIVSHLMSPNSSFFPEIHRYWYTAPLLTEWQHLVNITTGTDHILRQLSFNTTYKIGENNKSRKKRPHLLTKHV